MLTVLLIVMLKFGNLLRASRSGREHKRSGWVSPHGACIGKIGVTTRGRGIGWNCAEDTFITLKHQAVTGPIFQVESSNLTMQEISDQLHLLLIFRISGRHIGNCPDRSGQYYQSDHY